jgi:hypothetical protein
MEYFGIRSDDFGIWGSLQEWDLVSGDNGLVTQDIITGLARA